MMKVIEKRILLVVMMRKMILMVLEVSMMRKMMLMVLEVSMMMMKTTSFPFLVGVMGFLALDRSILVKYIINFLTL